MAYVLVLPWHGMALWPEEEDVDDARLIQGAEPHVVVGQSGISKCRSAEMEGQIVEVFTVVCQKLDIQFE